MRTTTATGTGEWEAALLERATHGTTVGADKHFDVDRFVSPVRALGVTPHVARKNAKSRLPTSVDLRS